jgi:hypothetical protein
LVQKGKVKSVLEIGKLDVLMIFKAVTMCQTGQLIEYKYLDRNLLMKNKILSLNDETPAVYAQFDSKQDLTIQQPPISYAAFKSRVKVTKMSHFRPRSMSKCVKVKNIKGCYQCNEHYQNWHVFNIKKQGTQVMIRLISKTIRTLRLITSNIMRLVLPVVLIVYSNSTGVSGEVSRLSVQTGDLNTNLNVGGQQNFQSTNNIMTINNDYRSIVLIPIEANTSPAQKRDQIVKKSLKKCLSR